MKFVKLTEGNSYYLDKDEISLVNQYLQQNPNLPMHIVDHNLEFDDYTIGSITIDNLSINISPRLPKFSSNDYFEMQLYNEGIPTDNISSFLEENQSYGLQENLISVFLNNLQKLVDSGIDGNFIKQIDFSNSVHGRILVSKIDPMHLAKDEIPIEYDIHTFQTVDNKIIKLALNKTRTLISNENERKSFAHVYGFFQDINTNIHELPILIQQHKLNYTEHMNQYYPTSIKLAIKILSDIKLNMKGNKLLGSSYLVNSNDLFEKYSRNVLKKNLNSSVLKWSLPHPAAKYKIKNQDFYKSYIPDILINYNENKNSAYAILDAKNKDISNYNNLAQLPDLYQVIFYCQSLKTKLGGLIYPSKENLSPVRITLKNFADISFYAFFIDFSLPIKQRNQKFADEVIKTFSLI